MAELTKDNVKVIVQEYMKSSVVFRGNCIIRHEGLEKDMKELKNEVNKMGTKLWAVIVLLLSNLIGLVFFLVR